MNTLTGLFVALMLLAATPAWALGPSVGPGCTIKWNAVTTNTDGSAITLPVTYEVYAAPGIVTTVGSPPILTTVGLTAPICSGQAAGQWTGFIVSVAGGIRSSLSAPANYTIVLPLVPVAPSGVSVQ